MAPVPVFYDLGLLFARQSTVMLGYAMQNRPIVQCRSALLVSLHDVSPITLAACKQAVGLLRKAAFPLESLTVLAIPFHEGQVKLCDHAGTIQF